MKFFHEMGYTYPTIGSLTYAETNALVKAYNEETQEQERQARIAQKRRR